jgi:hypothetical protein
MSDGGSHHVNVVYSIMFDVCQLNCQAFDQLNFSIVITTPSCLDYTVLKKN